MRFTIRDLLWLTVVVALGVGLAIERWRLAAARKENWQLTEENKRIERHNENLRKKMVHNYMTE